MASPSVQLPSGMESVTKSLDQQVMELSLNGKEGTESFPTNCEWYSSSLESKNESQGQANASSSSTYLQGMWSQGYVNGQARDTADQVATLCSDLSNTPSGPASDFLGRPTTRQYRSGTFVTDSKSDYKPPSPEIEPSFRASTLGDTMKALMTAAEAYGKQPNLLTTTGVSGDFSSGMSAIDSIAITSATFSEDPAKGLDSKTQYSSTYNASAGGMQEQYDFKEKANAGSGSTPDSRSQSAQPSVFETSDLAFRLRTTVKSSFLANELGAAPADTGSEKTAPLRSIDEIMRDYGIVTRTPLSLVNNIPAKSFTSPVTETPPKSLPMSNAIGNDLSTRKDGSQPFDGRRGFGSGRTSVNSLSSMRTPDFTRGFELSKGASSIFDSKILGTSESVGIMNLSQNNETAVTSSSNSGQETVRKYGSSVDFGAGGAASTTKYSQSSGTAPYSAYESKKTQPYSGDSGYPVTAKYSSMSSLPYDGSRMASNLASRTPSNMDNRPNSDVSKQGEETKNPESNDASGPMGPNFELISSMGSSTDALDYSMHQERQRLRHIDTIIATTPLRSHELIHKSYSSKIAKSEYSYPFVGSEFGKRYYSSPHVGTSTTSSDLMHRSSWAGSHGSNSYVPMPYDSYGGSPIRNTRNLIHPSGYRSSSINRGGHNMQYNNCSYDPLLTERLINENNRIKESKQPQLDKKPQGGAKGQAKKAHTCPSAGRNTALKGTQKRTSSSLSNIRYNDDLRRSTAKSAPRDSASNKKSDASKKDTNLYSSINNVFDLQLSKLWQTPGFGTSITSKPKERPAKYQPYTPQGAKDEQSERPKSATVVRKMFEIGACQPSVRKSQSYWTGEKPETSSRKTFYDTLSTASSFNSHPASFKTGCSEGNTKKGITAATRGKKRVKASKNSHPSTAVPKSILKQSSCRTITSRPSSAGPAGSGMRPQTVFPTF